jgi:hypothetical protein
MAHSRRLSFCGGSVWHSARRTGPPGFGARRQRPAGGRCRRLHPKSDLRRAGESFAVAVAGQHDSRLSRLLRQRQRLHRPTRHGRRPAHDRAGRRDVATANGRLARRIDRSDRATVANGEDCRRHCRCGGAIVVRRGILRKGRAGDLDDRHAHQSGEPPRVSQQWRGTRAWLRQRGRDDRAQHGNHARVRSHRCAGAGRRPMP